MKCHIGVDPLAQNFLERRKDQIIESFQDNDDLIGGARKSIDTLLARDSEWVSPRFYVDGKGHAFVEGENKFTFECPYKNLLRQNFIIVWVFTLSLLTLRVNRNFSL